VVYPEETYLSIATGGGGLDIGLKLACPGARCLAYVEREAFCVAHLVAAMEAGTLDAAPVWDDVSTFYGAVLHNKIRGIIGGYPCQPFSIAGHMLGDKDPRNLWPHIVRIIHHTRPAWLWFENVAHHLRLGFERVRNDLLGLGYEVAPPVVWAAQDCGAPHKRERMFILAYTEQLGDGRQPDCTKERCEAQRVEAIQAERPDLQLADSDEAGPGKEDVHPRPRRQEQKTPDSDETGEKLGHTKSQPRGQGRSKYEGQSGQAAIEQSGLQLEYAEHQGPCRGGAEGAETGRSGERENNRPATAGRLALWPPGPGELEEWREIIERYPSLEPATTDEAIKSQIRGVATRLAYRVHRLRMLGNGVVPVQAAVAFCSLLDIARREGGVK